MKWNLLFLVGLLMASTGCEVSSANTFVSPEAALEALHRDVAQGGDSLWMAERVSKAGETIPISCTERGGRCFCSFQYKIIDVHFTIMLPDNLEHIFVGINDITPGDVDYATPDTEWYTENNLPELTVNFQVTKRIPMTGRKLDTQIVPFTYNFIIDLGRMRATTF
ncbi:MAG: hypothetical protein K2G00_00600 [Duncaniella sp.]|nr:hypothetical protein [Duncaniella sp.]